MTVLQYIVYVSKHTIQLQEIEDATSNILGSSRLYRKRTHLSKLDISVLQQLN